MTPFIFSAITAHTAHAAKALATTIANGVDLLGEDYTFLPYGHRRYVVVSPNGEVYCAVFDAFEESFGCSCDAFRFLGLCKHLVCLFYHQGEIEVAYRAAQAMTVSTPSSLRC